jgi:hypothetical protein
MVNNEVFQALANAHRAKMLRAINARNHHAECANLGNGKVEMTHIHMMLKFNETANSEKRLAEFFGNAVKINRIFPVWVKFIECN